MQSSVSPNFLSPKPLDTGALQQNRAQSRLLYLFYDKESVKFPTPSKQARVPSACCILS